MQLYPTFTSGSNPSEARVQHSKAGAPFNLSTAIESVTVGFEYQHSQLTF